MNQIIIFQFFFATLRVYFGNHFNIILSCMSDVLSDISCKSKM